MKFKISSDMNLKEELQRIFLKSNLLWSSPCPLNFVFPLSRYTSAIRLGSFSPERVILISTGLNMHLSVNQPESYFHNIVSLSSEDVH